VAKVVELPREVVVEKLLPLLPASALLRARVVCRYGPKNAHDAGGGRRHR